MATNTVPIEIVLQDPANPIVPTPDSDGGSDNTNSNIAVPNTATGEGHTTMDGSSNNGNIFAGPSATVSIVSVVILALALSGIITLLIHKYYKNKKTKDNKEQSKAEAAKREHLAMAATSTMAVLAATVLVGQLLMTTTNAATANKGTVLSTPDKIQIIANRYDDVTIAASTKVVSYASTTTTFGYKIFMSMAGDNANLYLDGDTSSEYYFAPTTRTGLDLNSWGYNYDGEADYSAMPLAVDPLMAQQNVNAVEGDEFTVYYTMKADKDMPFGVYSGEIAYDIQGFSGFPASLTTMQGMTSAICDAVYTPSGTETAVPTATLTDIRDDKTYTIAKLADGKCWMTQNLDLQAENLKQGVALDSTNTDNPASGFTLPVSQISGSDSWGSNEAAINTAHVYDLAGDETEYRYCLDYRGYCAEEGDIIPSELLGNLYNWYSATAGTGTYSTASTQEGPFEATGSICPAGWRLPNNSNSYDGSNYGVTDYSNLLYQYGILKSATQTGSNSDKLADMFTAPLSILAAGHYDDGVSSVGYGGSLWSSLAHNINNARSFDFYTGGVFPWNSYSKYIGSSVRCVAR